MRLFIEFFFKLEGHFKNIFINTIIIKLFFYLNKKVYTSHRAIYFSQIY